MSQKLKSCLLSWLEQMALGVLVLGFKKKKKFMGRRGGVLKRDVYYRFIGGSIGEKNPSSWIAGGGA